LKIEVTVLCKDYDALSFEVVLMCIKFEQAKFLTSLCDYIRLFYTCLLSGMMEFNLFGIPYVSC